jgi:hypothetical protein
MNHRDRLERLERAHADADLDGRIERARAAMRAEGWVDRYMAEEAGRGAETVRVGDRLKPAGTSPMLG